LDYEVTRQDIVVISRWCEEVPYVSGVKKDDLYQEILGERVLSWNLIQL